MPNATLSPPAELGTAPVAAAPLLMTQPQAWRFVGLSKTKWFAERAAGRMTAPVNVGGRAMWRTEDLRAWVERLRTKKGSGRTSSRQWSGD